MSGEPLEDGGLGLGVDSEAERLLHGAVDDRLRDAALLTGSGLLLLLLLFFTSPTILS